jgi:hypothetical protein
MLAAARAIGLGCPMADYRCYFLSKAGRITHGEDLEHGSDAEAIAECRQRVTAAKRSIERTGFEVWLLDRHVHSEQLEEL